METNTNEQAPLLVSIEEAARRLSMGRSWTYEQVLSGELKSVKLGRSRRISVQALEEFVALLERRSSSQGTESNTEGQR